MERERESKYFESCNMALSNIYLRVSVNGIYVLHLPPFYFACFHSV